MVGVGATPYTSVSTGANTYWLTATVVFKSGGSGLAQLAASRDVAGALPTRSGSTARGALDKPPHHGSRVRVRHHAKLRCSHGASPQAKRRCRSLRTAAGIATHARWRFVYEALVKDLSPGLFCRSGLRRIAGLVGLSGGWFAWSSGTQHRRT